MTDKEIVRALRCMSTPGSLHEDCTGCPYYRKEQLDAELNCACMKCSGIGSSTDEWEWRGLPEAPEEHNGKENS